MKSKSKLTISIIAIVVLVFFDQVTKKLAEAHLAGKERIEVLGDYLVLVYATNRGGFLSFASGAGDFLWMLFFIILPLVVLIILSIYIIRYKRSDSLYLAFWVLVLSGGIGNLTDRILYGEVIDFINIGFGNVRTGIFNVADLYLNLFAIIVLLLYLLRSRKEKTPAV